MAQAEQSGLAQAQQPVLVQMQQPGMALHLVSSTLLASPDPVWKPYRLWTRAQVSVVGQACQSVMAGKVVLLMPAPKPALVTLVACTMG